TDEKIQGELRDYQKLAAAGLEGQGVGLSILVHGHVCPGVQVTFDDLRATFERRIDGPVRIQARLIGVARKLVAINPTTGSITELDTEFIDLNAPAAADSAAGQRAVPTS